MATKKQTVSDRLEDFSGRLNSLNQVIELCAFAAEARRTLDDIQMLETVSPDFEKIMEKHIDARAEWSTHDDVLGLVLKDVAHQINALNEQLVRLDV